MPLYFSATCSRHSSCRIPPPKLLSGQSTFSFRIESVQTTYHWTRAQTFVCLHCLQQRHLSASHSTANSLDWRKSRWGSASPGGVRRRQIGACGLCSKPICSHRLDAREAVLFNNSARHELFLGRGVFGLQGYRAEPSNRWNGNTSVRFGWTLFAVCLALVARSRTPRQGLGHNLPHGLDTLRGGPAATGIWEPVGHCG